MAQAMMRDRLDRITARTSQRLDTLAEQLPQATGRQMPFDEYRSQAELYAVTDPEFREQYEAAKRQYEAAGRVK